MIISCNNLKKSFGIDTILDGINFHINDNEKAAIIGVNGAGKTTLFKIIIGELSSDSGDIIIPKDVNIGYFSQNLEIDSNNTVYNELLHVFDHIISVEEEMRIIELKMADETGESLNLLMKKYTDLSHYIEKNNGYEYKSRIKGVIKGLGFTEEEFEQPINQLSGGQKTRIALGKILLTAPKLLLLDEPTNHLDIDSVQWLEDYLKNYKGSIIIISHDRYFLDKIVSKVIEIENKKSYIYNGNYSFYASQKQIDRDIQMKHYINQQKEIKHQEEVIRKLRSYNREKFVKRAESREKALNKMEVIDKPENLPDKMNFMLKPKNESGNDVLSVIELSKSFEDADLFENVSFEIKKGEKTALIGPNGVGKTTLFRIILNKAQATKGNVKLGSNVSIGYYDQEHQTLNESNTIFDEISNEYPKLTNLEIRNVLAAFVFTGDDVFKTISSLSGGEKGRVALAKIMLSNANFLILDEPTNHLDIVSKEILENAIKNYSGTCLYISHDRYFINNTANKIIELYSNGAVPYLGNYDYYVEKKADLKQLDKQTVQENENINKLDWKRQKEEQAELRKKENNIKRIEKEIEETEIKIEELNKKLEDAEVYTNAEKSKKVYDEKTLLEDKLSKLYEEWELII